MDPSRINVLIDKAFQKAAEHGLVVSIIEKSGGSVDPITGVISGESQRSYQAVIGTVDTRNELLIRQSFGIVADIELILFKARITKPANGAEIAVTGGKTYQVMSSKQYGNYLSSFLCKRKE
jgi:hypothetical protein